MSKELKIELLKNVCKAHGILYIEIAYQDGIHKEFIKGKPEEILAVMEEFNNLLNSRR